VQVNREQGDFGVASGRVEGGEENFEEIPEHQVLLIQSEGPDVLALDEVGVLVREYQSLVVKVGDRGVYGDESGLGD
jgi:hypothetical protein